MMISNVYGMIKLSFDHVVYVYEPHDDQVICTGRLVDLLDNSKLF